jgi:hypothetical protein
MVSAKQLAANIANALRSTGPRTEEGKQRSSLNARRHNLTGQVTAMTAEDRIAHDVFSQALISAMAPEGALELQLAQRVATDSWRLNRASAIEDNIFALGLDQHADDTLDHPEIQAAFAAARTFSAQAKSIELLTLYEQRINRTLHRNLALLQQLQATRKAERKAALKEAAKPVQTHKINDLPEHPTPNGSVFSTTAEDVKRGPNPAESEHREHIAQAA